MEFKNFGNTGVKVSALVLGTMTFGEGADKAMCKKIYNRARDKGINFFDCADVYANGESERILGGLIKDHRDKVLISSKAFYPTGVDRNARGLSRFHLTKAIHQSLKNLGTDYLDVFYLHNFDDTACLEDSLATVSDFVRAGKILYLGVSNFSAWQTMKTISIADKRGFARISCIQPMYNLLKRQAESELLPMAKDQNLGVFSYGPLAGGFLTGKYLLKETEGGRFEKDQMYAKRYQEITNAETVRSLISFAKKEGYDPVSLAISWVASHPDITSPIIGARNVDQLDRALNSVRFKMNPKLRELISGLSKNPALANDREEDRVVGTN